MKTIKFISKSDPAFNIITETNDDIVHISMIRKGDYELIVTADGFQEYKQLITIVEDDEFTIFLDEIESFTIVLKVDDIDITQTAIRIDGYTINQPVIGLGNANPSANIRVWE